MLRLLSGAALAALTATAAMAADLPLKAKALAAPVAFTWTGCFVGGHVGGLVSQDHLNRIDVDGTGFIGGGQAGCDYQFASSWVIGAEARAAWSSLVSSHDTVLIGTSFGGLPPLVVPAHFSLKNDILASATARLGYTVAERWLVYVRGGAAFTQEKADYAFAPAGTLIHTSATTTRTGWTVGTGAEWAFAPHWSVNVEYNYYDFGDHALTMTSPSGVWTHVNSLKDTIHAATVGVNYRF